MPDTQPTRRTVTVITSEATMHNNLGYVFAVLALLLAILSGFALRKRQSARALVSTTPDEEAHSSGQGFLYLAISGAAVAIILAVEAIAKWHR
jgi:hypothetical protein